MSRVKPTLNDETRRLQKALAILIACHCAIEQGAEFGVADVLAVVIGLVDDSLRGIDRLELIGGGDDSQD